MFKLKQYQENTLHILREFLKEARYKGADAAFKNALESQGFRNVRYDTHELGDIPYVCLRLPTGGGKTVLASYAIYEASRAYLQKDYPLVLWLVPTNTIRQQTLEVLTKPGHPYREALDKHFKGNVKIFDIADIDTIRPYDLESKVCIVVGTLATLRVNDKTGRNIYRDNEAFQPHFERISAHEAGLDRRQEEPDKGRIMYSFVNLCYLHRPLVIMDEAHNARTRLTFDVLKRVHPKCIIEFTATPNTEGKSASNLLFSVSASELKSEEMIKLPIMLYEYKTWQQAVSNAVAMRKSLEKLCEKEKEYIRPIVLFQAESDDKETTVKILKTHLMDNENIDPESIAIATGDQRELDSIDLLKPECQVKYIITKEALKEGWDCSFAYIFCSVATVRSGKDIEQLLGRVLRMPYAKRRSIPELNNAYAHICSPEFAEGARNLADNLINMGFEKLEVEAYLQQTSIFDQNTNENKTVIPPENSSLILSVSTDFDQSRLDIFTLSNLKIKTQDDGSKTISVSGTISQDMEKQIIEAAPENERKAILDKIQDYREKQRIRQASLQLKAFKVPRLCAWVQGELEWVDEAFFLEAANWNLLSFPIEHIEIPNDINQFELDLESDKVVYHQKEMLKQSALNDSPANWTEQALILWLDREIHQPDVFQTVMYEFLRRMISFLITKQNYTLSALVAAKYLLSDAILKKIKQYRQDAALNGLKQVEQSLFNDEPITIETSFKYGFDFDPNNYPVRPPFYQGRYKFQKHINKLIGDLNGEEINCAIAIDTLPQVKTWARNIPRYDSSFWLPTSSDRFYPDFVAKLNDERILAVEYKGAFLKDNPDTLEKETIGKIWEAKSNGKCLFLMAVNKDAAGRDVHRQIQDAIKIV